MKICVVIGSMKGYTSNEYNVIKNILDKDFPQTDVEYIMLSKYNIEYCCGCCKCFFSGEETCPICDDIGEIKSKIVQSEVVIISSPVYLHQISGLTKNFIDRLSSWAHLFKLCGTRAIVISSTSTNGSEYVTGYLKKVVSTFGCIVVGSYGINMFNLNESEDLSNLIEEAISCNSSERYISQYQDNLYKSLRLSYLGSTGYETEYWKENSMFDFTTFRAYHKFAMEKSNQSMNENS